MKNLKTSMIDTIIYKLRDYDTIEQSPNTIAYMLWEEEYVNGTCTFSRDEAIKWINKYFSELDEVVENYQFSTGEMLNPFSNPEMFQVIVSTELTNQLISNVWYNNMTLKELIKALKTLKKSV